VSGDKATVGRHKTVVMEKVALEREHTELMRGRIRDVNLLRELDEATQVARRESFPTDADVELPSRTQLEFEEKHRVMRVKQAALKPAIAQIKSGLVTRNLLKVSLYPSRSCNSTARSPEGLRFRGTSPRHARIPFCFRSLFESQCWTLFSEGNLCAQIEDVVFRRRRSKSESTPSATSQEFTSDAS